MSQESSPQTKYGPGLAPPKPITSEVPGTWAHSTMSSRVREIARRTLAENLFSEEIRGRVEALIAAIPQEPLRKLNRTAPDWRDWERNIEPYVGQNWLTPPWFVTETYFYRRLIEATGYYEPGPGFGADPFHFQKEQGLITTLPSIEAIAILLQEWIEEGKADDHIAALLAIDLWGNRADLSLWPADHDDDQPMDVDWEAAQAFTLADDSEAAISTLNEISGGRIYFIVDNASLELIADLALADYLLSTGTATSIVMHLKPHPTFVSDAMISDVMETITFLSSQEKNAVSAFGRRLAEHVDAERLVLKDHAFWVSPLAFWEMPVDLRQELSQSDLIISKGDANYRRLLGDREWPFTTPFAEIVSYTPAPLLALRTLKGELASGIKLEQIDQLNAEDPQWLVNGRWGVIQFAMPGETGDQAA